VPGLGDHEVAAPPHDAPRFAERRVELVAVRDPPFRLRDDLVRDDEDVAVLECRRRGQEAGEVVAGSDLRQALDRDDAQLAQGRPVTRRPVCVL